MTSKHGSKRFSEGQRRAIETFDRDLCVISGAGSGKTTVLVERFFRAMTKEGVDPERLLAITYTDKAACEMKQRLVARCNREDLPELRRKLENAFIGTIHSFCAKFLREHPIESGVDPFFSVLGQGEAGILAERVLDELFEREALSDGWIPFLKVYGEAAVRQRLKYFYDMNRAFMWKDNQHLQRDCDAMLLRTGETICSMLLTLQKEITDHKPMTGAVHSLFQQAKEAEVFFSAQCNPDWGALRDAQDISKSLSLRIKVFAEEVAAIRVQIDLWISLAAEELGRPQKNLLVKIYRLFEQAYEAAKQARAAYDFEDLLLFTERLLTDDSSPAAARLRRSYQEKYSYILVDEFQDTSPLQCRIIDSLKKDGNLFIVGDVQQSIYGFRFADPKILMEKLRGAETVTLTDNYRSRPEILEGINHLFAAMAPDTFLPLRGRLKFKAKAEPSVEINLVQRQEDSDEGANQARALEARAIVQWIQAAVERPQALTSFSDERPVRYGDFAILFRASMASVFYEKELREHAIPYEIFKGKGFYDKPEIKDILNFLEILENPSRDIAFAATLRSPIAGLSAEGLLWLSQAIKEKNRQRPLHEALTCLEAIGCLSEDDRKKLTGFSGLFEKLLSFKDRLKISEMISELVRDTHLLPKFLTEPDGRQKAANLNKLIDMARQLESAGFYSVQDFVRYVRLLAEDDQTGQSQARLYSSEERRSNTVVLSTIHAAKGLEFNYVIAADLSGQPKKDFGGNIIVYPEQGIGMRFVNPVTGEWVREAPYDTIKASLRKKQQEEADRLLYVAMTRAKEHLLLSGSLWLDPETGLFAKDDSWFGRIVQAIAVEPSTRQTMIGPTAATVHQPFSYSPQRKNQSLRLIDDCKQRQRLESKETVQLKDLKHRLDFKGSAISESVDVSVTRLLSAGPDPMLEETFLESESGLPPDAEEAPANDVGTIYHRLMELMVCRRYQQHFGMPKDLTLGECLSSEQAQSVFRMLETFWKSDWGRLVRNAKNCYPELPFIFKSPYGLIRGQMDLVLQMEQNKWIIVDYKTSQKDPRLKDNFPMLETYERQIGVYCLVFSKLYGLLPEKGILYFSAFDYAAEYFFDEKKLEDIQIQLFRSHGQLVQASVKTD